MATLRDRNKSIPGGFKFLQPQTGFQITAWASFDAGVKQIVTHRRGNMYLARKHNWAMEYAAVAFELDAYNAKLCEAHGWTDYIVDATPDPPKLIPPHFEANAAGFAGGAKKTAAAVKLVVEWLGSGLKPVEIHVAEKRAATCIKCPAHIREADQNLFQRIGGKAAEKLRRILEIKNDLRLRTTFDHELGTCGVCDCGLKAKGFVPIEHILSHTDDATKAKLPATCWILKEGNKNGEPISATS